MKKALIVSKTETSIKAIAQLLSTENYENVDCTVSSEDAREILETLVQGKRLKDISDLPLDLSV